MSKKVLKEAHASAVEKQLYKILGDIDEETMVAIMKKYLRTHNTVTKKGGCNCQNLDKIRGGFVKKLINKASVGVQNLIRKSKDIDNLRLLASGEGIHIPTTNYCGPGTNLAEADKYGVVKHNIYGPIDSVCQRHDNAYEDASKESDKDKRKRMIMEADELMLQALDRLPEELQNNATFKASKYGIALKNGFEKLTGKMLYGGNPHYDLDKIIKYVVKNNINNVKKLENLGKARLVNTEKEERNKKLVEVKEKKEDAVIKKLTEKEDIKKSTKFDYIKQDNRAYEYYATLNPINNEEDVKYVEVTFTDNNTNDIIHLQIPFIKDTKINPNKYSFINTKYKTYFEPEYSRYYTTENIKSLFVSKQHTNPSSKYLAGLFNIGFDFTLKSTGETEKSAAVIEATLNIEHLLTELSTITYAKIRFDPISKRTVGNVLSFKPFSHEMIGNKPINFNFIKSKIE